MVRSSTGSDSKRTLSKYSSLTAPDRSTNSPVRWCGRKCPRRAEPVSESIALILSLGAVGVRSSARSMSMIDASPFACSRMPRPMRSWSTSPLASGARPSASVAACPRAVPVPAPRRTRRSTRARPTASPAAVCCRRPAADSWPTTCSRGRSATGCRASGTGDRMQSPLERGVARSVVGQPALLGLRRSCRRAARGARRVRAPATGRLATRTSRSGPPARQRTGRVPGYIPLTGEGTSGDDVAVAVA